MSSLLKNSIRFVLFILIQVYILNQVPPLHRFVVPYLYFLYILWLPFKMGKLSLLIIACLFGLTLDLFTGTLGLHAAACVMIAYIRPFILSLLLSQETTEQSYTEPSINSMGWAPYSLYATLLTFFHHFYLVLLEWLQFGDFIYFIGKVGATSGISLLLIFLTEMLFNRKAKYRTNK
ncbi:MAG: rod shape-determining protein MreD [Sphingobacteriia bacterium]|nr:MAG: rod shape-determining protein MreD [Sphingobacteriia bacterium]TAG30277.1 MAG: rod shape-determining protein MreD [Sphingobacteriia bacterium]TAH08616.1 MAG: rod shape-determining protein MreD [Sphingobacteriia bacterium]